MSRSVATVWLGSRVIGTRKFILDGIIIQQIAA